MPRIQSAVSIDFLIVLHKHFFRIVLVLVRTADKVSTLLRDPRIKLPTNLITEATTVGSQAHIILQTLKPMSARSK